MPADIAKLLAFSKRYTGYEGSRSGTNLDAIITQFIQHDEARKALKKDTGIDIQLFDGKGQFKGVENMFAEFEKLRKLDPEKRLQSLTSIFRQEGGRIAGSMVEQGVEGWKNINSEASKAVPVQEKITAQMATYNAKVEAANGSWTNLKATAFTGLMDDSKWGLDKANEFLTWMQKVSAENPGIAKTVMHVVAMGSASMALYSGIKMATTGWKMFRLATAISKGSDGLVTYLQSVNTEAGKVTTSLAAAEAKSTGLQSKLNGNWSAAVTITSIIVAEYALNAAIQKAFEAAEARMEAGKATQAAEKTWTDYKTQLQTQGQKPSAQDYEFRANVAWATSINAGLNSALRTKSNEYPFFSLTKPSIASEGIANTIGYPISYATGAVNPFASGFSGRAVYGQTFAQGFKQTAPALGDPEVMTQFLRQLSKRVPDRQEQEQVKSGLKEAFPEAFAAAMNQLSQEASQIADAFNVIGQQTEAVQQFGTNLGNLTDPFSQTQQRVTELGNEAGKVPPQLNNISNAAGRTSGALDSLNFKIANFQMPTPQASTFQLPAGQPGGAPFGGSIFQLPSRAIGGVVEKDGLAMVHANNVIVPAKVGKGMKGGAAGMTFNYSPVLNMNGGSKADKAEFAQMLAENARVVEDIVARRLESGRLRA